jgi:hypothetical protein
MKAVILTMAAIRKYDNLVGALEALGEEGDKVVDLLQQNQIPASGGILIFIEGYASLQSVGSDQIILLREIIRAEALGNNPNTELLNRVVIYFGGKGILNLRVVYTTNPLKRIVYDITSEDIRESHV